MVVLHTEGVGKGLNVTAYMLVLSEIGRFRVRASSLAGSRQQYARYLSFIYLIQPVLLTLHQTPCHVSSCPCNNACTISLAICRKSRALCPVSRLLSVSI